MDRLRGVEPNKKNGEVEVDIDEQLRLDELSCIILYVRCAEDR